MDPTSIAKQAIGCNFVRFRRIVQTHKGTDRQTSRHGCGHAGADRKTLPTREIYEQNRDGRTGNKPHIDHAKRKIYLVWFYVRLCFAYILRTASVVIPFISVSYV